MSFNRFAAARDRLSHGSRPGFVYAIVNPAFAGLVKVGCTSRTPTQRAIELNRERNTGTPGRFSVAYSRWFPDCQSAEARAHEALRAAWVDREWFRSEVSEATAVIDTIESRPQPPRMPPPPSNIENEMNAILNTRVPAELKKPTLVNRIGWWAFEIAMTGALVYAAVTPY